MAQQTLINCMLLFSTLKLWSIPLGDFISNTSRFFIFFCKMQDELGRSQYLSFPPSFCNHVFIWNSWKYQIVDHLSSYQNKRNRRHVVIFVSLSKGFIKPPNQWCMVYLSYWVIHSNCAIHYKGIVNGKKSYIKKQQS